MVTVLISSWSTPEKLNQLVEEVKARGVYLDVQLVEWKEGKQQISRLELTVQSKRSNGQLSSPHRFVHNYNVLTEGNLFVIQASAEGLGPVGMIGAHGGQVFGDLWSTLSAKGKKVNHLVYSTFSDQFDARDGEALKKVATTHKSHFTKNYNLIERLNLERDPGLTHYQYRYYYNDHRLIGSFGISEVDMSCDAEIKEDDEGVVSLFVSSNRPLSPFALLRD